MKEIVLQTRVIEAVESIGGAGDKLSHRFKIGVPDLCLKLLNFPLLFAECKLRQRPVIEKAFDLEVTKLQREFLLRYDKLGQPTCVISFLHSPMINYQVRTLWIGIFPPMQAQATTEYYTEIPKHSFNKTVAYKIEQYLMEIQK